MASLATALPVVGKTTNTAAPAPRMAVCLRPKVAVASLTQKVSMVGSSLVQTVQNGAIATMMRHRCKKPRLGRPADQRKALIRSLTTELLRHGRITTTEAKAKAIRPYVDHMITLAKGGSLHQRRQAMAFVFDKQLVHALFNEVPTRYEDRAGGYTRMHHTSSRRGDNAPMRIIELV